MKVYGYELKTEKFVTLKEASIACSMEELDKIIEFLQHVSESHKKAIGKTDFCHSHYQDWDSEWNQENTDLIVVSEFK
ncbi:MAG: hypothetical protein FWG67_02025 [Defluviitaleaceae bacterium]|nr:hypothetical protein [Defluviitaleaceae bacterium]